MNIVAIDPGTLVSAMIVFDCELRRVNKAEIFQNNDLICLLRQNPFSDYVACEMVGHYGTGMPAGKEVFDTCVFIGRIMQATIDHGSDFVTVLRPTIKTHLCGTPRAKDGNVRQALIDRLGAPGKKKEPGPTYGISSHMWSALAVAVYAMDNNLFKLQLGTASLASSIPDNCNTE